MFERGGRWLPISPLSPYGSNKKKTSGKSAKKRSKKSGNDSLKIARRRALFVLPVWLSVLIWTWAWWFYSVQIQLPLLYMLLSAALFYQFALLPSIYLLLVIAAKNPKKRRPLKGQRIAVITPCVPSQESLKVIERQLRAMSQIEYPHDSWILDESNSKRIKKLAAKYGVRHFSRKNIKAYNQDQYPFKARTKAGNVNAWIDHVKRRNYDFFVQLDIDHTPSPCYLDKTIGHFRDKQVGWVQSPSIYKNTDNWIVRGAAELEWAYHGPIQMGYYGLSETPMVVGSHCLYRMAAIKQIGGFQPTRAEDHLDTVAMTSAGWKGVFVPEILAEGEGPESFGDFLTQQFAWAYSMFQVVMKHSPRHLVKIRSFRKLLPLLFCETYYPLWAVSYAITFFTPVVALALNRSVVSLRWTDFFARVLPAILVLPLVWSVGRPLMPSKGLRLSWRGAILEIIRWPSLLLAILNALFHVKKPYMVTPKGKQQKDAPPVRVYLPFVLLGLLCSSALLIESLANGKDTGASSQVIFLSINTMIMAAICLLDLNIAMRSVAKRAYFRSSQWLRPLALITIMLVFFAMSIVTSPIVQNSAVFAFSRPVPADAQLSPSLIPVWRLSDQQLVQQIASYHEPSDTPPPAVGIYDPAHNYLAGQPYIRHSFVDWRDPREVGEEILQSYRLNAVPLITIEPAGYQDGAALLQGIATGEYDDYLNQINKYLQSANAPVYVRFAHEMDLPGAFPWSTQSPDLYINAYRHVVDIGRTTHNPNLKWVWSPGGIEGVADTYYPGDDYVDVVGTTLLYDRYWSGDFLPNFDQLSHTRTWMVTRYSNKPVWVTEFGAGKADPVFQKWLIQESVADFKSFGFSALIYINIDDPHLKIPNYTYDNYQELRNLLGIWTPLKPLPLAASNPAPIILASKTDIDIPAALSRLWDNLGTRDHGEKQPGPTDNLSYKLSY